MKKKPTNYTPHLLIILFAFCVIVSWPGCYKSGKTAIKETECPYEYGECPSPECSNYPPQILSKKVDDRGLISVIYVDGPDTLAYDYLTLDEYKEIFRKLTVSVQYHNVGDTLLPSYVCNDTMIVVDAVGFNRDMGLVEQGIIDATDSELDSLTHLYCTPLK